MAMFPAGIRHRIGQQLAKIPEEGSERFLEAVVSCLPARFRVGALGRKLRRLGELLHIDSAELLYRKLLMIWNEEDPAVRGAIPQPSLIDTIISAKQTGSYLQWMMLADIVQYLPDDILVKVDRAAMAVSLESRAPLLHHRVVEFAAGLPMEHKVNNTASKRILRDVLYRYVPKELIERPKMGFAIPLASWLREGLRDWAENLLSPNRLESQGMFNVPLVSHRWQQHQSAAKDYSAQLWCVLMYQAWLDEYSLEDPLYILHVNN